MSLRLGGSSLDPPSSPATPDPNAPILARMRRGAGWLLTISVLSGFNSLLQILDAKIRFLFGLGTTQLVDALARGRGGNATLLMITLDGLLIGTLVLCWRSAKVGSQGAFLLGMLAYGLDGLLLLYFRAWLDAGVHAYALVLMGRGYVAARELEQALQGHQPAVSDPNLH